MRSSQCRCDHSYPAEQVEQLEVGAEVDLSTDNRGMLRSLGVVAVINGSCSWRHRQALMSEDRQLARRPALSISHSTPAAVVFRAFCRVDFS